ncbi:allophanate hydrolase subunit 1 [Pseudophaeobacter sp. EL27]|uniref:5-oxoprolinase subunit B family protein n=1 Tax=Pseudophaeobacter sp. EL27 TaxID=2107580 RepID=UPI00210FEFB7|nr:carboxyltransferase domain-containing protein [Pseudophaeobacter sp. EL27]
MKSKGILTLGWPAVTVARYFAGGLWVTQSALSFPIIRTAGLDGMLVTFADALSEPSNRATLAFSEAVKACAWPGVQEVSTSLASVFLRFDSAALCHAALKDLLLALLETQDWQQAALPPGRRLWRVPTVFGTGLAPQLAEAADAAGMSEAQAVESLGSARVRVLTIGFAPGQPYLGPLGAEWNLPRQTELTPQVPTGALVLAISQFVLFATTAPTGWRHVGQTGFRGFQLGAEDPIALRPGDEMIFTPVSRSDYDRFCLEDSHFGGASREEIPA